MMANFAFGRYSAIFFVCDSLIISFVPQMTNAGIEISDNSDGLIFGSFTIKPSISAFLGSFRLTGKAACNLISNFNWDLRCSFHAHWF